MNFITNNKTIILSSVSLIILSLLVNLFKVEINLFRSGLKYFFVATVLNIAVFTYMLLDNDSEFGRKGNVLGFTKQKIIKIKFILINILTYLIVLYFIKIEMNPLVGFVLFFINNSVSFLVFNLLKNYKLLKNHKNHNDTILLFCFGHIVLLNLVVIFNTSSLMWNIVKYIPMTSIYFAPTNSSYEHLFLLSLYIGYIILILLAYRKFRELAMIN